MLEAILPVLLAFVSLGAFELGTRVRNYVHVVMPYRDPLTVLLTIAVLSPAIASWAGHEFIDPTDIWYIAFAIAFLSCYSLAYIRGELNLVYVNVHTIISERFPAGAQEIKPVVYYEDRYGNLCLQEQSFKEIFKSVFFGIRSPLRLSLQSIQRERYLSVQKVLYPKVELSPIDVVEEKIEESVVKRWIFPFKVRSYSYTPAPMCIDNTQQWLVSAYSQENLTKEVTRKEAQLLECQISSRTQFIGKSGDLLSEVIGERTPGAEIYNQVAERLAPEGGIGSTGTVRSYTEREKRKRPPLRRKKEGEE